MGLSNFLQKMVMARQLEFEEGRFEMLGIRGVNLPVFTLTKIIEEMYEAEGDAVFDMLFEAGRKHGHYGAEEIGREMDVAKREFFDQLLGSGNVMGLGKMEIARYDLDENVLQVTITDSPFVEEFQESPVLQDLDRSIDDLQRGIFHGFAEELFENEVSSVEDRCAFQGDDVCRITITVDDQ